MGYHKRRFIPPLSFLLPRANGAVSGGSDPGISGDKPAMWDHIHPSANAKLRTADASLGAGNNGEINYNLGATALVTLTLPTPNAPPGSLSTSTFTLDFRFVVVDADGIRVQAPVGVTITIAGAASTSGGYVQSVSPGSSLMLLGVSATEYVAYAQAGTWTTA